MPAPALRCGPLQFSSYGIKRSRDWGELGTGRYYLSVAHSSPHRVLLLLTEYSRALPHSPHFPARAGWTERFESLPVGTCTRVQYVQHLGIAGWTGRKGWAEKWADANLVSVQADYCSSSSVASMKPVVGQSGVSLDGRRRGGTILGTKNGVV